MSQAPAYGGPVASYVAAGQVLSIRRRRTSRPVKPDIGSESRFLLTPPAFDAPVRGVPSEYCHAVWYGKKLEWLGYLMMKKFRRYVYSFWQNARTWQTHRQTPHDDIGRAYVASCGKNSSWCVVWQSLITPEVESCKWCTYSCKLMCGCFCSFHVCILLWNCCVHQSALTLANNYGSLVTTWKHTCSRSVNMCQYFGDFLATVWLPYTFKYTDANTPTLLAWN